VTSSTNTQFVRLHIPTCFQRGTTLFIGDCFCLILATGFLLLFDYAPAGLSSTNIVRR
jgi:hypothetical protein